ncbi:hypothetical protein [Yoonia sp. SS1-5]|uniref:Na+-dependent transporter n=1 Tax=Yoonia rhodophyticola TaxID=3137370 RepID=A0AAN0MC42_9RHOB
MLGLLERIAPYGRWCLVIGLVAGLALPGIAALLRPWLPELIAALLCLAALRIGPTASTGGLRDLGQTLRVLAVFQVLAPMLALGALHLFGVTHAPWALALVLVLAAPSVTGSPHFAIMMGKDPVMPMRLLLVGTAIFPLTVVPVLWLSPAAETTGQVIAGALRLLGVIAGAVGLAFVIRSTIWRQIKDNQRNALDGASAVLLAVVVVGLMSAVGPALADRPVSLLGWLCFALVLNFGLQLLTWHALPLDHPERDRTGAAIVAGNRNIALFLVALPEATTDVILLFIGCYQVPMYLTPLLMKRLIAR